MKNNIAGLVGTFLIIGFALDIFNGDVAQHIMHWETAELVGYNLSFIVFLIGGISLIYVALRKTD